MNAICTLIAAVLLTLPAPVSATPTVLDSSYSVEILTAGVGAVTGMHIGPTGDLYFTDYQGGRVLKVTAPLGSGSKPFDIVATGIPYPTDLAFAPDGRMFVTSSTGSNSDVLEVFADGSVTQFASGFSFPTSVAYFGGNLFVSNSGDGTIVEVDSAGNVSTFLAGFSSPHGPFGISVSPSGILYFVDHGTGRLFSSDQDGQTVLLGTLSALGATYTGVDNTGRVFVSDVLLGNIFRLGTPDSLSLFASGFVGKSNPPMIGPNDMVFGSNGTLYVGDGDTIWRISNNAIPEPHGLLLFGIGLSCVAWLRFRRR